MLIGADFFVKFVMTGQWITFMYIKTMSLWGFIVKLKYFVENSTIQ